MNGSPPKSQDRNTALMRAYEAERLRLHALAEADAPQGDYLRPVFGEGSAENARVLFVGEAPGGEEAASGRPFVGKAGRQLDALLKLADIPRDAVYITNVVKYRPVTRGARSVRNRTPGAGEVISSLPLLALEICTIRPGCIVTLGNTPLTALLRLGGVERRAIGELHGRAEKLTVGGCESELFALYHPASGIYNRSLVPIMEKDILSLGEHLVKGRQSAFFDGSIVL